jgi:hypothetical protein
MPSEYHKNVNHRLTGNRRHRLQLNTARKWFRRYERSVVILQVEEEYDLVQLPFTEKIKGTYRRWRDATPDDFMEQTRTSDHQS